MAKLSPEQVLLIAKRQFGVPETAPSDNIPQAYLDELAHHLAMKGDDQFRITLQPNEGYGFVTCLKDNCNTAVPLLRRIKALDGGLTDGFGTLSPFRTHLAQHKSRSKPVTTSQGSKTPSSSSQLEADKRASNAPAGAQPRSSLPAPSSIPVQSNVPKKRLSDSGLVPLSTAQSSAQPAGSIKRFKPEPSQKAPFSAVTNTVVAPQENRAFPIPVAKDSSSQERSQLDSQIDILRRDIEQLKNMPKRRHDYLAMEGRLSDLVGLRDMPPNRPQSSFNQDHTSYTPAGPSRIPANHQLEAGQLGGRRTSGPQTTMSGLSVDVKPFSTLSSDYEIDDNCSLNDFYDDDEAAAALAAPFVQQVGVNIPASALANFGEVMQERDHFRGPQADPHDLEKFLGALRDVETFDGNATVAKALAYLDLNTQSDRIPGMTITLLPHQLMGVAWMLQQEKGSLAGGCLADEMGLGKTIQMIATMVKNPSKNPKVKTNLIIAPLALLDQWKLEIEEKTDCGLTCFVYHGSSKLRKARDFERYDVVLTTSQTMALEWPDFEAEERKNKRRKKERDDFISDDDDLKDTKAAADRRKKQSGLLFHVMFYRVIVDEAQVLRNRRTRASRASTELMATYRWCLTGTPIMNTLGDAYGYIRFLRIRPWYDVQQFQSHIGLLEKKNPNLAVTRLQGVMRSFLLRRRKDTELDGKKLIELPEKDVAIVKLDFTKDERDIYNSIEAKNQAKFNRYLRAGTVLKNYSQVLVLLLRLRQICAHPCLIQENEDAFRTDLEFGEGITAELATESNRARRLVGIEFVTKVRDMLKKRALDCMEAERTNPDAVVGDQECPICFDALNNATITPCCHVFCRECIVDVIQRALPDENEIINPPCPVCRASISEAKLFALSAFEPTDEEVKLSISTESDVEEGTSSKRKGKGRAISSKGESFASDDSDDDMSDFIVQSDEDEEEKDARRELKQKQTLTDTQNADISDSDDDLDLPDFQDVVFGRAKPKEDMTPEVVNTMPRFLPSTKMKFMMDRIQHLAETKPDEKTLVISQWTGCLNLVSEYLTEHGIVHVKYQGSMNRRERDAAVRVFMSKDKACVMLMSTKCGGVGLNLTRANNVISLDLCWSYAVENQAFDRVHRLGQQRPVRVQRAIIADTVEDRILTLQERKQLLADGSLGEGRAEKLARLGVRELANLFGLDIRGRRLKDANQGVLNFNPRHEG